MSTFEYKPSQRARQVQPEIIGRGFRLAYSGRWLFFSNQLIFPAIY